MSIQALTPPQDVVWTRMAYSSDMIDTNFGNNSLPPKWRSSLAVFYYILPDEDVADDYPNGRIVYLKFTCSITGWNPNEELRRISTVATTGTSGGGSQSSFWNAILASGWASTYWPCLGAIMQIAVYPGLDDKNTSVDDYPVIIDFEPKKREIYESVSDTNESLSGSSEDLSVGKSNSSTFGVEASGGFSIGGFGISGSSSYSQQSIDTTTTDSSREARETQSHSTSFSQMYQLFNGYHLGTNRAVFLVAPRPHTVSNSDQTEFNLIDGQRKLEGLQDEFLVIYMPKTLNGFCVQANLDTGHNVMVSPTGVMLLAPGSQPGSGGGGSPVVGGGGGGSTGTGDPISELLVTRRIVRNCGKFDANGNFTLVGSGDRGLPPGVLVTGEYPIAENASAMARIAIGPQPVDRTSKVTMVNQMNTKQRLAVKSMLSGFTADNYTPRTLDQTSAFKALAGLTIQSSKISVSQLVQEGLLTKAQSDDLSKSNIFFAGDIFSSQETQIGQTISDLQNNILNKFINPKSK